MTETEVRLEALKCAVELAKHAESFNGAKVIWTAKDFENYLNGER